MAPPVRSNAVLADKLVIRVMRTDPEPMNAIGHRRTERPIIEPDLDAVEASVSHRLEM